jgi:lysozyme family protein
MTISMGPTMTASALPGKLLSANDKSPRVKNSLSYSKPYGLACFDSVLLLPELSMPMLAPPPSLDQLIDGLLSREGGFSDHPADRGGPTKYGITEAVARAHGYNGPMSLLPRGEAAAIYRRIYWLRPALDQVARKAPRIAAELFDTGANMGPGVATTFLQRALTALNRNGSDYPDLEPDGRIGATTLAALAAFLKIRGAGGEIVLMRALEALQGERYLRLAEKRLANEAFLYGWLANRIGQDD